MKYFIIILILVFTLSCNNEELFPEYPEDDYILELIQNWGMNSEFESLPVKSLNRMNLELRVWSGFGVRGNNGVILNQTNGNWSAYSIDIRTCIVLSHKPEVSDSLKRLAGINKEFADEINCNQETMDDLINEMYQYTDSLFVTKLHVDSDLKQLWSRLKDEGIFNLTTADEPFLHYTDGHTYAIEIKVGNVYRAFVSENVPVNESDIKAHKIAEIIDQYLGTSLAGYPW